MKTRSIFFSLTLLAITPAASYAQAATPANPQGRPVAVRAQVASPFPEGTAFNLDFPGGPVQDFVAAVEKATGNPFNLIIPASAQHLEIPPVRVRGVTLGPLLGALSTSSTEQKTLVNKQRNIESYETGFTFTPSGPDERPVWNLTVRSAPELPAPAPAPPTVRFYQLKPHLDAGLKAEDITTAAETAWKMMKLNREEVPELKFHEETGIMIAAGTEPALAVIESVLAALPQRQARSSAGSAPGGFYLPSGGVPALPPAQQPARTQGPPTLPRPGEPGVRVPPNPGPSLPQRP